jgi:spore coat polysaccharide biosynthesis protein SpsF (cytidylyltransferase family)
MLLHQIERLQCSQMIDKLVIATSKEKSDDRIEQICLENGVEVFRGSLNNVLDRFYQCAKIYNPHHIVRLTADCPLADWQIIDEIVRFYLENNLDYVATSKMFPDGLDVEVLKMNALEESKINATLPSEIEHVTQYVKKNSDKFSIGSFNFYKDLSHLRWTVDEPEDFILVEKIYQFLYPENNLFVTKDIIELLEKNPNLVKINNNFLRNEGLKKSLNEDISNLNNV